MVTHTHGPLTSRFLVALPQGPFDASSVGGSSRHSTFEVRRWRGGVLPDASNAVGGARRLSQDRDHTLRVLALVPDFPRVTWGCDELGAGEMWNSIP